MEKDKFIIKQALAFVSEDTKNLKKVFANKKLQKFAVSGTMTFYVCEISAEQPTQDDPSVYERQIFSTTATDIEPETWKFMLEYHGWRNVNVLNWKQSLHQHELFPLVKNDAITESTIPKARFAKAVSYISTVRFVDNLSGKTQDVTFIVKPSYMTQGSFENFLKDTFKTLPDITIKNVEIAKAKAPGTLDFKEVKEVFLRGKSGTDTHQPFAWIITCRDSVGNQHEFKTVSSTTPVELYERKLRELGFTNINSTFTSKPGTVKLDDLQLNIRSPRTESLSEKIEQGADKILDLQEKFNKSKVGKGVKVLKDIIDWARK